MARTPIKKARQASKPSRASAPVRFVNETRDSGSWDDPISGGEMEQDEELDADTVNILREFQKHQAKKASIRSSAFQTQKKAIYAAARKNGREIVREGVAYLESAKAKIAELKGQEVPHEKYFKDFAPINNVQKESINSLHVLYPSLLEELFPRRSDQINAASTMLKSNPSQREDALRKFSRNARNRVEQVRENEKIATDASKLIKHYKNLLRT